MGNDRGQTKTLNDVTNVIISNVDKKTKPGERPVRLCNYTDVYKNDYIRPNIYFMNATATEHEIEKCSLFKGDVVITKDSEKNDDIGVPAYIKDNIEDLVCGYHLVILRPNPHKIDGAYLFYALSTLESQHQFHARANGITRFGLRKADIGTVLIPTPPLSEQRAIAHILGSLDDKIELNRQMNKTLEDMARSIFKSWFVDFDPVYENMKRKGAVTQGRKEDNIFASSRPGVSALPSDILDLFPDSFEDSELGEIPKGWEFGTLEDIATLKTQSIQPYAEPEKIWEHYSIPAFDAGRQPIRETGVDIKSGKYLVSSNSVLASKLNPRFPRIWLPDVQDPHSSICSSEFMPFIPRLDNWRSYLYEMLKSHTTQSEIISRVTGSTGSRQRVKPKEIAVLPCFIPPNYLVDFFCYRVNPLHDTLLSNIRQSATLRTLRDILLPKLISGELRVPDAEKFIEEAGI